MSLASGTGEDRLLARILGSLPAPLPEEVVLGPGDDAAVVRWPDGRLLLLSTDAAEEGVHFDRRLHPPRAIGRRAVAAAVSDLAAMGGSPVGTLVSLVTPPREESAAAEVAAAAGERARELGAPILGGNITSGARLGLHVTVVGATAGSPLRRSGAQPGDALFVTGELGGAALGLDILRRGADGGSPAQERLLRRQLDPIPRIAAGGALAGTSNAGMDISDGLALDLHRLAAASRVGAVVETHRIPLAEAGAAGLDAALFGGEDYELLLSGPEAALRQAAGAAEIPLFRIGRITDSREILLRGADGRTRPLPPRGWDAFRATPSR